MLNWELFLSTLSVAGQGYVGVFAVICAIWLSVVLMLRVFRTKR